MGGRSRRRGRRRDSCWRLMGGELRLRGVRVGLGLGKKTSLKARLTVRALELGRRRLKVGSSLTS
jgi:hypothetical protein